MSSPISYWRQSQSQVPLLGKQGQLLSFTTVNNHLVGVIKLRNKTITAPLIFNTKAPQIGDLVIAVLRILKKESSQSLIEYGLKFQLKSEI